MLRFIAAFKSTVNNCDLFSFTHFLLFIKYATVLGLFDRLQNDSPVDRTVVCPVCLSVLSVTLVGVLWPNSWMD